jgi:hypothetical protein
MRESREKRNLRRELDEYYAIKLSQNDKKIDNIITKMKGEYDVLKQTTGLNAVLYSPPYDTSSQEVYKKFMPHSPYSLYNLLNENFDPKEKEYISTLIIRLYPRLVLHTQRGNQKSIFIQHPNKTVQAQDW